MHVIVKGRRRKGADQWTEGLVENWLHRAVRHSGLTVIAGPQTKQFQGHIHGWAIIAESHISAHLDVMDGVAFLELFSCKPFDEAGFLKLCAETFELEGLQVKTLTRELD